jgi:hypothetical protein
MRDIVVSSVEKRIGAEVYRLSAQSFARSARTILCAARESVTGLGRPGAGDAENATKQRRERDA